MTEQFVPVKVGSIASMLLVLSQIPADPRDALKEFVANAVDAYRELGTTGSGAAVQVYLERKGTHPCIKISDDGIGMSDVKLRDVPQSLFNSEKVGKAMLEGHKAIGITSYLQLANECEVVSRSVGSAATHCLRLPRKSDIEEMVATGRTEEEIQCAVVPEDKRKRITHGTDVYLLDVDPEVLRLLTSPKLAEHLGNRYRPALIKEEFRIQLCEGKKAIFVKPEVYRGSAFAVGRKVTPRGYVEFDLFISPPSTRRRAVSIVGEAGNVIMDDLTDLEDFSRFPWNSGQVEGEIKCNFIKPSTGRKTIVIDRKNYPEFKQAVLSIEKDLAEEVEKIRSEFDSHTDARIFTEIRRIFATVIQEMEELESPFKTRVKDPKGEEGPGQEGDPYNRALGGQGNRKGKRRGTATSQVVDPTQPGTVRQSLRSLPSFFPRDFSEDGLFKDKSHLRSYLDRDTGVIYLNTSHPDFLRLRNDARLRYQYYLLLVCKEYVVYNQPAYVDPVVIGEEMVRFLTRAQKYSPREIAA